MTTEKKQSTQDAFLNHVRKHKINLTIFLVNGIKLQGIITGFDSFSVMLRKDQHLQLVYKHAISTLMPNDPVKLHEDSEDSSSE
jgi:host factor-I protein